MEAEHCLDASSAGSAVPSATVEDSIWDAEALGDHLVAQAMVEAAVQAESSEPLD